MSFYRAETAKRGEEDTLTAKLIRSFIEGKDDENSNEYSKRLLFGSGDDGDDDDNDGSRGSGSTGSSRASAADSDDENESDTSRKASHSTSSSKSASSSSSSSSTRGLGLLDNSSTSSSSSSTSSSSSSSTSTRPTTTSSSSSSSSSSSKEVKTHTSAPTTSSSAPPSTSFAFVTSTPVPTVNSAATESATPSSKGDDGPGAGPIIGIVAGSLAGVAILAVIIGFLIKKFGRKEDPYESDPFDRDEFRRQSVMLPDQFETDEGYQPSMSEIHRVSGPFSDPEEYSNVGAGAAGAGVFTARNESGGPRPPTMFQKHLNAQAQYSSEAPSTPSVGALYHNEHDVTPQLPPMAFGGSDPYSMAGVGRHNTDVNLSNPYGYLDRSFSNNSPQFASATSNYTNLDRSGSEGSSHGGVAQPRFVDTFSAQDHDTAGRPGTAEGRSGTPDLPNVQQTYALGADEDQDGIASPTRMVTSPQHMSEDYGGASRFRDNASPEARSPPQQPLQVRNLLPNPHEAQNVQGGRPISSVSSRVDDEAAYGGVW